MCSVLGLGLSVTLGVALGVGVGVDLVVVLLGVAVALALALALSEHLADLLSGVLDHAGELFVAGGEHALILVVLLELDGVSEHGKADHGDEDSDEEAHYCWKLQNFV